MSIFSDNKHGNASEQSSDKTYTTKDVAEMCGVTEYTVRRWIGDKLHAINGKNADNSKKQYRFSIEQIMDFIDLHASGKIKENCIAYLKAHRNDIAAAAALTAGSRLLGASMPIALVGGCIMASGSLQKIQAFINGDNISTGAGSDNSTASIEDIKTQRDLLEHNIGTAKCAYELQKLQSDDSKEAKIKLLETELNIRQMEATLMELDAKLKHSQP